jgi:hypothetical protein
LYTPGPRGNPLLQQETPLATVSSSRIAVVGTRLEREIRSSLLSLNYASISQSAACSWIESRGTIQGCPCIDRSDWQDVNDLIQQHLDRAADRQEDGSTEGPVETWPEWTRAHIFHPSASDRAWWTEQSEAIEDHRACSELEARASEFAAVDAMSRGLVPADRPVKVRTRRPTGFTDADMVRHLGCV